MGNKIAKNPFHFYTSSLLVEITGKKAYHLKDFVKILKEIDESSIFYHIHHAFREYSFAPGQYSNDFARWVAEDLEEMSLAERLSSINIRDFTDLESLRRRLVGIIEDHLMHATEIRKAPPGREFYFQHGISIAMATAYEVNTLAEFAEALDKVGMRSLYYHFFYARLRLGRKTNDFSHWIETSLGEEEIARRIDQLDPYFMTMDQLKEKIISICLGEKKAKKGVNLKKIIKVAKKIISKWK